MKKKALFKDFLMEVKLSRNRFLSIVLIVALGVAFFSGLRAAEPDMKITADNYYDETNLSDIRILSTLGLTDEDVTYIASVDGIKEVEPSYSLDALMETEDTELVVKLISATNTINKVNILEGRMPRESGECVIDSHLLSYGTYKIGDTITFVSGNNESLDESLKTTEYTIVGVCNSSYYLSYSRGNSSIGSGKISGYVALFKDDFAIDAYTEIYATVDGAKELNSYEDEYEDKVAKVVDEIEKTSSTRKSERYYEVTNEPAKDIHEGETKLAEKEQEATDKLADAKKKIDEGKSEITDGEKALKEAKEKIKEGFSKIEEENNKILDGKDKIEEGKKDIDKGKVELSEGKVTIKTKKDELNANSLKLKEALAKWQTGYDAWNQGKEELEAGLDKVNQSITELEKKKEELEPFKDIYVGEWQALESNLSVLYEKQKELLLKQEELKVVKSELDSTKAILDEQSALLQEGLKLIEEKEEELAQSEELLSSSEQELLRKEKELLEGYNILQSEKDKLVLGEEELRQKEDDLREAKETIIESEQTYLKNEKEVKEEIEKAKQELIDAKNELAKVEQPTWYVLDRGSIQTFVEYEQDSMRIGNIGKVFPVIFFLVAALVSLTTMTRMIEEQRISIGTLKSLGYSKKDIASKYIFYALFASLIGSVLGVLVGQQILPRVIITAYKILYNSLPKALTPYNGYYAILSTIIAVGCITATAILSCYKELRLVPANLMRPPSPKLGKRVFLERIPFLWKNLNFTSKSTIRNLLRYKKRFFMTVFGIGGCMALLLVGFGVKDSISAMSDIQYVELWHQNSIISINQKASISKKEELIEYIKQDTDIADYMQMKELTLDISKDKVTKSATLLVPEDVNTMSNFITLRGRLSKKKLQLMDDGVIVSEKLASLLDVKKGDTIIIKNSDSSNKEVTVLGITENYMLHYVFMSPTTYTNLYKEQPQYNKIYVKNTIKDIDLEKEQAKEILLLEAANNVTSTSDMQVQILDMLESLNIVVYVLIIAAGLLAFVVLYNLNNININERKRELATLKVLGFSDMEVATYVYRENTILTIIGCMVGVILGIILHRFVIITAEIDAMMFGRNIELSSFVISILLTFSFSAIINFVMFYQLRKINMVESLKSVE